MPGGLEAIYRAAYVKFPTYLTVVAVPIDKHVTFLISTIIFQAVGFYSWPSIMQYVFSAKSEKTIRHNQCIMPVYMLMYVFLVTAAFFTLVTVPGLKNPDDAFMGMIVRNLTFLASRSRCCRWSSDLHPRIGRCFTGHRWNRIPEYCRYV